MEAFWPIVVTSIVMVLFAMVSKVFDKKYKSDPLKKQVGFMHWLCLLFVGLRLTEHIDWSWWCVLSPMWMGPAVIGAYFALALLGAGVNAAARKEE